MARRGLIIGGIAAVLLAGGSVGGYWMYQGGLASKLDADVAKIDPPAAAPPRLDDPAYFSFDAPFTTNMKASAGILQVSVSASSHYAATIDNLKTDSPALRSAVLAALSDVSEDIENDDAGKQQLLTKIAAAINRQLASDGYPANVDAAYFTDFIIQDGDDGQ